MHLVYSVQSTYKLLISQKRQNCYFQPNLLIQKVIYLQQMKPHITPYDRNSRLGLKMLTVNPCNQFIIQNLIRWKINVEKQGLNQFYTYNLAIQAVRKYPLPILCFQQMKVMEGFGKFFCTSVAKLIRKHYQRGRLPTKEEKEEDDKEHEEFLRREMKKMRSTLKKGGVEGEGFQQQIPCEDNQSEYSQFNDNFDSQFQDEEDDEDNQSEFSNSSEASNKSNKGYRPKPGGEIFNFLKAMSAVIHQKPKQMHSKTISRAEINTQLYNWRMDKVRNWNKITEKLKQSGYIKIDAKDEDFISLTTKGRDFLAEIQQSEKTKVNENTNIIIFRKQKLDENNSVENISLLANTRGSYKSEDSFLNSLQQTQQNHLKQIEYQLGSFIWMVGEKVLDYIVVRFKLQNFDPQEFNDICLRAKNSTCRNIIIILESPVKKQKLPIQKQGLSQIVCKSRAAGFKVIITKGDAQSIRFLNTATEVIAKNIQHINKGQNVFSLGKLQIYNQKNKKLLPISVKQINRKMLKCIPKMSRDTIQVILQKLPTLGISREYLHRLNDCEERLRFLLWILKDVKQKLGALQMLDDMLFRSSYELDQTAEI